MNIPELSCRHFSRRHLARLLAGAGLTMVTLPILPRRSTADGQPVYYTWQGYDDPSFFPDYVGKHGTAPLLQTFLDESAAIETIKNGFKAEVIHPCAEKIDYWRSTGVLQPIDVTRLQHWPDVFESMKTIPGANRDGEQWFIPIDWGNYSVLYRSDLVDFAEESYSLLWDERYAGRLSVNANETDTVVMAALVAGISNLFDMSDDDLAKVRQLLVKQRPLVPYYWSTEEEVEQGLASGTLVACSAWNATMLRLKRQGVPVGYMSKPKEGIITWCCGVVLAKAASEIDKAYDLIDAMLAPTAGKWLIEAQGYGHSNRKSYDLVSDDTLASLGLPRDATRMLSDGVFLKELTRPDAYKRILDEVIAGA